MRDAFLGTGFWLACAIAMSFVLTACGKYTAAWKITEAGQSAATLATKAMTSRARDKHASCKKLHAVKTPELRKCVDPEYSQAKRFRRFAVPTINAGIRITVAGLTIAEKTGGKADWKALVKPAVCAVASVLEEYKAFIPDKAKAALSTVLMLAKGVTCK